MSVAKKSVDTIRILSAEAIQRANSGHTLVVGLCKNNSVRLFRYFFKFLDYFLSVRFKVGSVAERKAYFRAFLGFGQAAYYIRYAFALFK